MNAFHGNGFFFVVWHENELHMFAAGIIAHLHIKYCLDEEKKKHSDYEVKLTPATEYRLRAEDKFLGNALTREKNGKTATKTLAS